MRIGCVPYLNAKPLAAYMDFPVEYYVPSQLEGLILDSTLQIALISSITYLQNKNLTLIPEGGIIAAKAEVASVCLFVKKGLKANQIKSMDLGCESRTSVALLKILWKYRWDLDFDLLTLTHQNADAQLIIGDRALFFNDPRYDKWDLSALWFDLTQKPFVFAVWARNCPIEPKIINQLKKSKSIGLERRSVIASETENPAVVLDYLTKNIQYEMTPEMHSGLALFQAYAYKLGLVSIKKDLTL